MVAADSKPEADVPASTPKEVTPDPAARISASPEAPLLEKKVAALEEQLQVGDFAFLFKSLF